ncbi:DUF4382 domain-containing protein [Geothrix edaphica]|uniref:DUF4382 domain-containing protein n=1 Tax=Geothrix edaphica TaxID=2927976 RepID=A0ABQ5PU51_9BACT|nr:DUF4382 domain-containing protein [Geothrix edaphica]GLH65833.1 hypothetical protein GETHED_01970 [Geothrix edaphica]
MRPVLRTFSLLALPLGLSALALSIACSGSSSAGSSASATPMGTASIILTDAPSDQWSAVEVVVTKVAFLNKSDHTKEVVAFQGASAKINLVDLDSVGELLASAQIPAGTYDALRITIDPASVNLVKADGTTVAANQIHVLGSSVLVGLSTDLVVTANGSNAVQLDFDLAHPLFLVQLPDGSWAMNLQVRHRPNANGMMGMAQLMFRHRKGTVASVGASSFVLHTDSGNDLTVNVDAGSWFFDADARAQGSFAGLAAGKHVLISLRMQPDGSLWAVRVWYSVNALPTWTPEGHLYGVDRVNNRLLVSTSTGAPRAIAIDSDTTFTYRTSLSLGTGTATLANLWSGFKVQVQVKDPLATPMHAQSVNIQRAVDAGQISAADATQLTYAHPIAGDRTYAYTSPFSWWYVGLPGLSSTSTSAFASAVTGAGDVRVQGLSDLVWNGGTGAWNAGNAIFLPVALPQGTISGSYSGGQLGFTFTNSTGASQSISVSLNPTVGLQPAVLEVTNQSGVVTVAPIPVTDWAAKLVSPARARVAVVPKPDGSFAAYAVVVFSGF